MMNLSLIKDLDILQGYHLLLLDDSFIFSNIYWYFTPSFQYFASFYPFFGNPFLIQKIFSRFSWKTPCFFIFLGWKNICYPRLDLELFVICWQATNFERSLNVLQAWIIAKCKWRKKRTRNKAPTFRFNPCHSRGRLSSWCTVKKKS